MEHSFAYPDFYYGMEQHRMCILYIRKSDGTIDEAWMLAGEAIKKLAASPHEYSIDGVTFSPPA